VGLSAFAHKAGLHSNAVLKTPLSYEHLKPEWIGNQRRILVSEQAGLAAVVAKAQQFGIKLEKDAPLTRQIVERIKQMEAQGYLFEAADASLHILLRRMQGTYRPFFELEKYHVNVERRDTGGTLAEAAVKVKIRGASQHMVAEGDGPVNALDSALRKALSDAFPALKQTHLVDFKVRVLQSKDGTGGRVRVMMETTDGKDTWGTVGVHENIIEACWEALTDSLEYKLLKDKTK
jgi:2-isopropylmalate synthase